MEKRYSNIDDLFRDKFKDFELYPPDHIWDNIKQQIKVTGKDKSGKGLSNGSIIGITIILVISSIVAFYLLQTNTGYTFKNEKNEIRQSTGTIYNNSTPRSATLTSQDINKTLPDNNSSDPKALKAKNRQKLSEKPASNIDSNIPKGKANLTVSSSAGDINVYSGVKTSQEITNPGFTTGSPLQATSVPEKQILPELQNHLLPGLLTTIMMNLIKSLRNQQLLTALKNFHQACQLYLLTYAATMAKKGAGCLDCISLLK